MDNKTVNLACPPPWLALGYRGENNARPLTFDFSAWAEEYGAGVLQLLFQRPGDEQPYPVLLDIDGTSATWAPSATDTAIPGQGKAQLVYTVGETVVKNAVLRVLIEPSLGASGEPPTGFETWLEQLTALAAETQANADRLILDTAAAREATAASEESAGRSAAEAAESAKSAADSETASALSAALAAQAAQRAAAEGGWVQFYIDSEGYLHYVKTPNVDLEFYLQDGNLYVRA